MVSNTNNNGKLDLIIIGAGPTGINTAIEAKTQGLNYLVLEKGVLVNSIYNFPDNMTFFSTSTKIEIGNIPFISHLDKPTRREALEYYRRVAHHFDLCISYGREVLSLDVQKDEILVSTTDGNVYHTKNVIIATGYFDTPRRLDVEGEHLDKVSHYYDDAHRYIDQNIIVVGGANSACDVALETWQKGAKVTMVVREKELYQKVKYWILPNIENRIKEGSIKAYFSSNIEKITSKKVTISTPEGLIDIDNDFVLAMTGYSPNYNWFEKIGIQLNHSSPYKEPRFNKDTFESNLSNVYIAGVIQSGLATSKLFIENTRTHGKIIISDIINKSKNKN